MEKCPNCPVKTYRNIMKYHAESCKYIPVRKNTTRGTLFTKMMREKFKPFLKSYEETKKVTFMYRKIGPNEVEIVGQKYENGAPLSYSLTLYDRDNRHIRKTTAQSGKVISIDKEVFKELGNKVRFKITILK